MYPRPWIEEEYKVLFGINTIDGAVEKLRRSWQAVVVKDGHWRYRFIKWCQEKGKDFLKGDKLEFIKEFIREHEELKRKTRESKKQIRIELKNLIKEYEEIKNKLEKLYRTRDLYTEEAFIEEKDKLKNEYNKINSKKTNIKLNISDNYIEKYNKILNDICKKIEQIIK